MSNGAVELWFCRCAGGHNRQWSTVIECERCGAVNPNLPRGVELMRYQRRLAEELELNASRRQR